MAQGKIYDINIPDKIIEKAKEVYLENLKSMAKPTGDKKQDQYYKQVRLKEEEFWTKVLKLPWDQQKQFIFARFNQDMLTPGIVNIKNKLLPAEKKALKSLPIDVTITDFIGAAFLPSKIFEEDAEIIAKRSGSVEAMRNKYKTVRQKAIEEIAEKGFSVDKETNK